AASSSAQACGCGLEPSTYLTISRPSGANPPPATRGAPANPASSRCRSNASTAGLHGPGSRYTTPALTPARDRQVSPSADRRRSEPSSTRPMLARPTAAPHLNNHPQGIWALEAQGLMLVG